MGWMGWCIIGALIGAVVGWERQDRPRRTDPMAEGPWQRLALLAFLCLILVDDAATVRGFFILLFGVLGAYQAAKIVAGAAVAAIVMRRGGDDDRL